jgi:hypothetical protein
MHLSLQRDFIFIDAERIEEQSPVAKNILVIISGTESEVKTIRLRRNSAGLCAETECQFGIFSKEIASDDLQDYLKFYEPLFVISGFHSCIRGIY